MILINVKYVLFIKTVIKKMEAAVLMHDMKHLNNSRSKIKLLSIISINERSIPCIKKKQQTNKL